MICLLWDSWCPLNLSTSAVSVVPFILYCTVMPSLHLEKDLDLEILTSWKYSLNTLIKEDCYTGGEPICSISSFSIFCSKPWDTLDGNSFKVVLVPSSLINHVRCGDFSKFSYTILLIETTSAKKIPYIFPSHYYHAQLSHHHSRTYFYNCRKCSFLYHGIYTSMHFDIHILCLISLKICFFFPCILLWRHEYLMP